MTRPKKVLITKERKVHTYFELWRASSCVLEKGLCEAEGSSWQFLSSILLTAFAFEAYLNHAGEKVFSCWNDIDSLSPLKKFSLLSEKLSVNFPPGKRPVSTIRELFIFRNSIAHGRSESIRPKPIESNNDDAVDQYLGKRPLADWEAKIKDSRFSKRAREDVEEILTKLHNALPQPKEHLFTFGIGSHSAKLE